LPHYKTSHYGIFFFFSYEKDHHRLTAIYSNHNIIMYDVDRFHVTRQFIGYHDEVIDMRWVGDHILAVATNSEELKLFNTETLDGSVVLGHTDMILALDASKNGQYLISGSKDHTARIWRVSLDAYQQAHAECIAVCVGHMEAVSAVAFSKKLGDFVVTGSQDKTLKLWDLNEKERQVKARYTIKAHNKDINTIDISPNDKLIATGSQDKTASVSQ
jgi:U3 small nucleolar RNA-associated protein 13